LSNLFILTKLPQCLEAFISYALCCSCGWSNWLLDVYWLPRLEFFLDCRISASVF